MSLKITYSKSQPYLLGVNKLNSHVLAFKETPGVVTKHAGSHVYIQTFITWWRHQMETFSSLLAICAGNSPVPGDLPTQRPVTRNFEVFFDLRPNKLLSKQSWCWWFETPSRPLWRHRNGNATSVYSWCKIHSINIEIVNQWSNSRQMSPHDDTHSKIMLLFFTNTFLNTLYQHWNHVLTRVALIKMLSVNICFLKKC